jgi:integrase
MRRVVYDALVSLPGPREGRVFRTRSVRTAFDNAAAEAQLDDFRLHDCRHHFASWFMMRGGNIQELKEILGHSSLAMTIRYAHLSPAHLRAAMERTEKKPAKPASKPNDLGTLRAHWSAADRASSEGDR